MKLWEVRLTEIAEGLAKAIVDQDTALDHTVITSFYRFHMRDYVHRMVAGNYHLEDSDEICDKLLKNLDAIDDQEFIQGMIASSLLALRQFQTATHEDQGRLVYSYPALYNILDDPSEEATIAHTANKL